MKQHGRILTLLALLALSAAGPAAAQTAQQPTGNPEPQQNAVNRDPIQELNLSPDQRQQIRAIRENNRAERTAIQERLKAANEALNQAVNAESPDEAAVDQRLKEVAAAQAAVMRMRLLTEIRIRRVLTVEQRETLRLLQKQAQENRRERLLANPDERERRKEERVRLNQRNGLGPFAPRRKNQRVP
ncbi:MAG TPA: periplasmic heavy metal sensor [Pyrinomonadaceae bacterium]|nr:periplasmic heavy metal sensor [Pyrinomonadaceae bacterium]